MQKQQIKIIWLDRQSAKDRQLFSSVVDGPYGKMLVLVENLSHGAAPRLAGLGFCGKHTAAQTLESLKTVSSLKKANIRPAPDNSAATALLEAWQNGGDVTICVAAAPKQKEIWSRLMQTVTAGKTCTYDGLANECGTHARVVGGAMSANPLDRKSVV